MKLKLHKIPMWAFFIICFALGTVVGLLGGAVMSQLNPTWKWWPTNLSEMINNFYITVTSPINMLIYLSTISISFWISFKFGQAWQQACTDHQWAQAHATRYASSEEAADILRGSFR